MRCKPKHTKLDGLIYDKCKECICQARLSDRDSRIAELYLVSSDHILWLMLQGDIR